MIQKVYKKTNAIHKQMIYLQNENATLKQRIDRLEELINNIA